MEDSVRKGKVKAGELFQKARLQILKARRLFEKAGGLLRKRRRAFEEKLAKNFKN